MKTILNAAAVSAAIALLFTTGTQAQAAQTDATASQVQKVSGSDDLFLVERGVAKYLTIDGWAATGHKQPVTVASITGTKYLQQRGLDPVYASVAGRTHHLSFSEWAAAGAPKPTQVAYETVKLDNLVPLFARTKIGDDREQWLWNWLTPEEWAATGFMKPQVSPWVQGVEYAKKYSAPKDIYAGLNGDWSYLTFEQWVAAGAPQPTAEVYLDIVF